MPSKRKQKKSPAFSSLQYALLGNCVNVYGAVEKIDSSPEGHLVVRLKDESGQLELIVPKSNRVPFGPLQIGDILRCYNLEIFEDKIKFGDSREQQCVAWSKADGDFTWKFATSGDYMDFNEKRITQLRALKVDDEPVKPEAELENHKAAIALAQVSGKSPPPIPERLRPLTGVFNQIRANFVQTLKSFSQIRLSHFTFDKFFNIFAQVLGIHTGKDYYVLQVWDASYNDDFKNLSSLSSLGPCTVIEPLEFPYSLHGHILNVVVYQATNWEKTIRQLKRSDIVLFANIHVNKRALGELALVMHEGHEDKRFIVKVPPEHIIARQLMERCNRALEEAMDGPSQDIPSQVNPLEDVNSIFSTQNSIPQWNPSTQALINITVNVPKPSQENGRNLSTVPVEEEEEMTILKVVEVPREEQPNKRRRTLQGYGAKRPKVEADQDGTEVEQIQKPGNIEEEGPSRGNDPNTGVEIPINQEKAPMKCPEKGPATAERESSRESGPTTAHEVEATTNPNEQPPKTPQNEPKVGRLVVQFNWVETSDELANYLRSAKVDYCSFPLRIEEKLAKIRAQTRREEAEKMDTR